MANPRFRPDIEGLRGLAILLVIAYHYGVPGFTGGYVGVDVFFVLSGYLITGLVLDEIERTGTVAFIQFYSRRARRLLPAVSVCLLAIMAAGYFVYVPFEQGTLTNTSIAASVYVSNIYFARTATDYLAGTNETNPFLHMWSLSVEEQFYFAWPLFLYLAVRLTRTRHGVSRGRLVGVMSAAALASFSFCMLLTQYRQGWAFFSSPTRAWEFAVGAIGVVRAPSSASRRPGLLAWVGFAAVAGSALLFDKTTAFPGAAALLPSLGTVLILRAASPQSTGRLQSWISARWLQWLGSLSYSLYLWHWPVLVLMTAALGPLPVLLRAVALALSVALAMLSYFFVERPIRGNPTIGRYPRLALAGSVTLTLGVAAGGLIWQIAAARAAATPDQARYTAAHGDRPTALYERECMLDLIGSEPPDCSFGMAVSSAPAVVLFGDSHAAQWFPAVNAMAMAEGWRLIPLVKSACPPADVSLVHFQLGRRYVECEEWRKKALNIIAGVRPVMVILSNLKGYLESDRGEWAAGSKRTFDRIQASGARIVYIRDTPRAKYDIPRCLARADWYGKYFSECAFAAPGDSGDSSDEEFRIDKETLSLYPGSTIIDMTAHLCPAEICQPETNGIVLYSDSNHLTATLAASLAPVFRMELNRAVSPTKTPQ